MQTTLVCTHPRADEHRHPHRHSLARTPYTHARTHARTHAHTHIHTHTRMGTITKQLHIHTHTYSAGICDRGVGKPSETFRDFFAFEVQVVVTGMSQGRRLKLHAEERSSPNEKSAQSWSFAVCFLDGHNRVVKIWTRSSPSLLPSTTRVLFWGLFAF